MSGELNIAGAKIQVDGALIVQLLNFLVNSTITIAGFLKQVEGAEKIPEVAELLQKANELQVRIDAEKAKYGV